MSEPRTEAGRLLLRDRQYHAAGLITCPRWSMVSDDDAPCECDLGYAILAIEAEAAAFDELPGIVVKDVVPTCATCGALLDEPPEVATR